MKPTEWIEKRLLGLPPKERYYICERCGDMITHSEIMDSIEYGGSVGMCYCEFCVPFWNTEVNDLDCETPRIFRDYTEIEEKWYNRLKKFKNEALRLIAFKEIPKDKLLR